LAPGPLQYADFSVWQRDYLKGEILDQKIAYWKQKLEGILPLQLPTDFARPSVRGSRGASAGMRINKLLADQLQELSNQQGTSLFMVLLSTFKVLLHRYSGQQDISVGTSLASRQQKELEGLIGFFVNTLALRDEVKPDIIFTDLLKQIKATTLDAYEHQELPFEKVVEMAGADRDPSRSPLFQVMLVFANTPEASKLQLGDVILSAEPISNEVAKFDITFFINDTGNGLQVTVQYSTDLYQAVTIDRMMAHFEQLLNSVVKNPQQKIGLLQMLLEEEEQQLLVAFNSSNVDFPKDKSVIEIFEEQVLKTPQNKAIVFESEFITYQQLNERSNEVANYLKALGIGANSLVPLYIERSADMMIGMLGIMKAGAAYVPIDTDFPQDRIDYMLEDTGSEIIVSNRISSAKLQIPAGITIVEIDHAGIRPNENIVVKPSANDLAYVIYTSGSTGKPKGVMIEHGNLVDYTFGLNKYIQTGQCNSYALVSTIATDLGNTVIYASLLSGGALHVFSKDSVSDLDYLHQYFRKHTIDCLKIVPSHWKALCADDTLLLPKKLLVFGGEALQSELVEDIRLSGSLCRVVNHYGPTETTIGKLLHEVNYSNNYAGTIPIGKPFSNTNVYVLSSQLQLCPVGVPGQLYISGAGLARGYYNNQELTNEKFIINPFIEDGTAKLYGTGDLVKWLPDGNILFIGRVDDQVKIRGYRIELGEIESVLQQNEEVSQAVVLARDDKQGNKQLVAYIVPESDYGFDRESIIIFLKERLPLYMIPAVLMEIESLPLTSNGKIDRKKLPDPESAELSGDKFVTPRNETETRLAAIWQDILEVDQVGINDDFFELGGHSLLAVRLVSAIRKAFKVEMPIGDIFDYPTVALLAIQLAAQSTGDVLPPIEKANPRPDRIPLSFSQERLWFIDQLGGSLQYHIPAVLRLTGKLDVEVISGSLKEIINRHEALRTVIFEEEGTGYQLIKEVEDWQLQIVDGAIYNDDAEGLQYFIKQRLDYPFNLAKEYLLRATLICLAKDECILVITLHHIGSDGWSTSIIVNELIELYNAGIEKRANTLPRLPLQYADYAIWQRGYLQGEILDKKLAYWKDKLADISTLQLYTDYPRPSVQSTNGAVKGFKVNKELSEKLQSLSRQQGATLFMTMLAVIKTLLYRYSGQQDIAIGTPVAGRQQQELEGLIGFFINTIVLRSNLTGSDSFSELLQQVRNTTLEAYSHQEVPFEKVVEAVAKDRDLSNSPLFQVMMVFQNTPDVQQLKLGEVELSAGISGQSAHTTAKFELTFNVSESAAGLNVSIEYCTDLYSEGTIIKMITHLKQLLNAVVTDPAQSIEKLPMLTSDETKQLLNEFNDYSVNYPTDKTIVDLFEEQVAITPNNIAIEFGNHQLSYFELNQRSNQLANYLRAKGVDKEMLVPICTDRSIEMLIGVLAILKAGGAYVPIDPEFPADRINFVLEDTAAKIVLVNKKDSLNIKFKEGIEVVEIDKDFLFVSENPVGNLGVVAGPANVAYVIYTSGSTGKPKGVLIEHRNVVRLFKNANPLYDFGEQDVWCMFHSFTFDFSVWEMYGALLFGGKLVIIEKQVTKDASLFAELIIQKQVTILNQTPSSFYVLQEYLVNHVTSVPIRCVIFGGEALNPAKLQSWKEMYPESKLINMYGITETTVHVTYQEIGWQHIRNGKSVIGKPIPTLTTHVLDSALNLLPVGVVGEMCVGGAGLARGYLNMPELTDERFIKDIFAGEPGARLYRSGDLGVRLSDGSLEYMGRKDDQVKIRGYRIELGEIENVLKQSGLVNETVVIAGKDATGSNMLICYVVPANVFDREQLIAYLKGKVPDYMIPSVLVEMQQLPLTANGKLDKKALLAIELSRASEHKYVAPRNELESRMAEIWQDLLGIKSIGVKDNFFELGGHSLNILRLVSVIRKKMEMEVTINDVFIYPTIAGLIGNFIEKIKNPSLPAANIKYLVPIKTAGNKVPLYIMAGGGGTALKFRAFAELLPDQPVYVLQPPTDAKELKEFPTTVEEIAAVFIEEILIKNPNGPFALSGHCLGGIIAFEMATQLKERGKNVILLAMFDSIIRKRTKLAPRSIKNLYHIPLIIKRAISRLILKFDFETFLLRRHTRQSVRYKMDSLRAWAKKLKANKVKSSDLEFAGLDIFNESADMYVAACSNYTIEPYDGDIILFYAKEHYFFLDKDKNVGFKKIQLHDDTKNLWNQFATTTSIHEIEGEHSEIFEPVHASEFAFTLQQYLNKSNG
jgi:amino acid adenylation domain-containing protein